MLRTHFNFRHLALSLIAVQLFAASSGFSQSYSVITVQPCPYDCSSLGLSRTDCRDWREGPLCYVEDLRTRPRPLPGYRFCIRASNGSIKVKKRCFSSKGETSISFDDMRGEHGTQGERGETGPQGERGAVGEAGPQGQVGLMGATGATGSAGANGSTGAAGAAGAAGANGSLRVYGDGSAGSRSIATNSALNDPNPQYTNFTVSAGTTLTVYSGTVVRCTGNFQNDGTIIVAPALRDHPRFGENGSRPTTISSGGLEALGGIGGKALYAGVARRLLNLSLLGGGSGYRETTDSGGDGGGNFAVICSGSVVNQGLIASDGASATGPSRGGGAGGIIILASGTSVSNSGSISATGGLGGSLLATDSNLNGYGAGGGGGGGIVHLMAPAASNSGSIDVSGGAGGAAGGAGAITGVVYLGGGSGGGGGGLGGDGGTINPGNIGNGSSTAGQSGAQGLQFITQADPVSIW